MADDDNATPATPSGYKPIVSGYADATVDTADPRYRSATEAAHKAGLSQAQFSQMLGFEASRVVGSQRAAAPASAPAAAKPATADWNKLSFAQKLARSGNI
jgi:hypothetical protein